MKLVSSRAVSVVAAAAAVIMMINSGAFVKRPSFSFLLHRRQLK